MQTNTHSILVEETLTLWELGHHGCNVNNEFSLAGGDREKDKLTAKEEYRGGRKRENCQNLIDPIINPNNKPKKLDQINPVTRFL